jgi:hypothetical protein
MACGAKQCLRSSIDFKTEVICLLLQPCAQVLLTLDNLANRSQYINARNTFTELLAYGAIPVVNENVSQGGEGVLCILFTLLDR